MKTIEEILAEIDSLILSANQILEETDKRFRYELIPIQLPIPLTPEEKETLTIGQIISELEKLPREQILAHGLNYGHSYRGDYSRFALELTDKIVTVSMLIDELVNAIGNCFSGYKRGEYYMYDDTLVYISDYGRSSRRHLTMKELQWVING